MTSQAYSSLPHWKSADLGMIAWDRDFRVRAWNYAAETIFGFEEGEILGQEAFALVPETERSRVGQVLDRLRSGEDDVYLRNRNLRKNGQEITCSWFNTCLRDKDNAVYGYASLVQDISEQAAVELSFARANEALQQRNRFLQLINLLAGQLHRSHDMQSIACQTVETLAGFGNPHYVAVGLGSIAEGTYHVLHARSTDRGISSAEREAQMQDLAAQACGQGRVESNEDTVQRELRVSIPLLGTDGALGTINLAYGRHRPFAMSEWETMCSVGQTVALALSNANQLAELEYRTLHDDLTGLPNRQYMHEECARMKADGAGAARRFALLLFDLDRFKEINDTLGHQLGDDLLVALSQRIKRLCIDNCHLFCRLGGDEFALLLEVSGGSGEAGKVADSLRQSLETPFQVGVMSLQVSAAMGLALYPQHAGDSHELLRCAEVAMYQAKRSVSQLVRYEPQLDQHSPERLALIGELGCAIRDDQLTLHYQPKVDLFERRVAGFEALLRWQHPRLGEVAADRFITLAETGDAIHALTFWVVDRALGQLRRWQSQGLDTGVAINISTRNLVDARFASTMAELIGRHDVNPERIELEVTETTLISDPARARRSMQAIAALGVSFSIDDFGTGYSSLDHLKRLPLHALKIDRSFIRDMLRDQQDLVIVRSTIKLARSLGLKVVAEGVEDQATFDTLRGMGCDYVQGFHISRALPVEEILPWWENAPLVRSEQGRQGAVTK